jgi:hypothetical protein
LIYFSNWLALFLRDTGDGTTSFDQYGLTGSPLPPASSDYCGIAEHSGGPVFATATAGDILFEPLSTPVELQLALLLAAVTGVGPGTSLADKVTQVQGYVAVNDMADACGTLGAFINQVSAQKNKKLTTAQAVDFIAQAQAVKATLDC